jgi:hypothetical protein
MSTMEPEGTNLTRKQREAIPFLIGARSIEEGRKRAGVGKRTIHRWIRQPAFQNELEKSRDRFIDEALERLKGAVTQAVNVLAETMNGTDATLRVRASGMVLDYFFRVKEIQEFETRLKRIEEALEATGKARH